MYGSELREHANKAAGSDKNGCHGGLWCVFESCFAYECECEGEQEREAQERDVNNEWHLVNVSRSLIVAKSLSTHSRNFVHHFELSVKLSFLSPLSVFWRASVSMSMSASFGACLCRRLSQGCSAEWACVSALFLGGLQAFAAEGVHAARGDGILCAFQANGAFFRRCDLRGRVAAHAEK